MSWVDRLGALIVPDLPAPNSRRGWQSTPRHPVEDASLALDIYSSQDLNNREQALNENVLVYPRYMAQTDLQITETDRLGGKNA